MGWCEFHREGALPATFLTRQPIDVLFCLPLSFSSLSPQLENKLYHHLKQHCFRFLSQSYHQLFLNLSKMAKFLNDREVYKAYPELVRTGNLVLSEYTTVSE